MILFLDDWKKYPDAIVHYETKNKSFLRFAGLLKKMGIKNHSFCLQLHNPLLKHVDPLDPNLTEDEKMMVADELSVNFFYFIREVARIELPGSPDPVSFIANRGNMAVYWLFFNYILTMLIQLRQTGKSATVNELLKGVLNYQAVNTSATIITKDNSLREDNTKDLQKIESYLPTYLKRVTAKDMDSTEGITVKSMGNSLTIKLAQKSVEAAKNLNRGSTDTIICADEVPYLYNIDISLPVALSAGSKAIRSAKSIGQPAGIVLYTSAGYIDTKSGKYAYDIYKTGAKWSEKLYDLPNREALENYVKQNSSGNFDIMIVEMNHRMLGYTDEWLKDTIRLIGATKTQAMVELLNIWVKGGTDTVLPKWLINKLYDNIEEPIDMTVSEESFAISYYVDKDTLTNKSFIISIDMSELLGKDSTTMLFVDPLTGGTLARGHYGKANINDFGLFLFNVLVKYPKAVLIIERNSMGIAVLDQLAVLFAAHNMDIFRRVFNNVVDDGFYKNIVHNPRDAAIAYTNYKDKFGFRTSKGGKFSRDSLYSRVVDVVSLCVNHIHDKVLIEELASIEVRKGRIDHKPGEHDDMVIAYLLAHWLLRDGKNLDIYGLNPSTILSAVVLTDEKTKEVADEEKQRAREMIVNEIDDLITRLSKADTLIDVMRIKSKIRLLKSRIDNMTVKTLNIDGRMKEILENKGGAHTTIG